MVRIGDVELSGRLFLAPMAGVTDAAFRLLCRKHGAARSRNAGWRIDYFIVSEKLKDRMIDAKIHSDIMGSDHCPMELDIRAAEDEA